MEQYWLPAPRSREQYWLPPPQVKVRHKHTHNLKERRMLKAKEGHTLKGKVGHTLKGKVGRLRVNLGMVHSRSALSLSLYLCVYLCVCVCVCNESSLLHTLVFDAHRVMDLSECCLCAHAHKHKHTHRAMDLRVSTPPPRAPLGKGRVESGGSGMLSRLS